MNQFNISYIPDIKSEDVKNALVNQQVLVVRSKVFVNAELCEMANSLQLVARAGSGVDNLDTDFLVSRGIAYINTPEANSQAVAEHTLGMMLGLLAKISKGDHEVRNHIWDREGNRGEELFGKTVGIIGYGHTGSRVAKLLSSFGVKTLAYDKYKSGFAEGHVIECDMNQIFEEADILTLHIPLTAETKHLVNTQFINQFKKPIWLLNLARGPIVATEDIILALDNKKIIGLGVDVLENERINQLNKKELDAFNALTSKSNVLLTPHVAGWTKQSYEQISMRLVEKISGFFDHILPFEQGLKEAQKFP